MTNRRRDPTVMLSWFVVLIALPYLGILLYLFIGRRKIATTPFKTNFSNTKKENISNLNPLERVLYYHGIPKATEGNQFELIDNGSEAYHQLMKSIKNAKESIYLATYIFDNDKVTQSLIMALAQKSKEGVDVRVLIDAYGSLKLYFWSKPLQPLYDAGVKIEFFMPLKPLGLNTHFNLRLHRKIYLFDNQKVFSGGTNLSQTYLSPNENASYRWDDLLFSIQGPATTYYRDVFISDWNFTASDKEKISLSLSYNTPQAFGEEHIQVVPSGPDISSDAIYDAIMDAIYGAKERIWIVSPYFIPNSSIMEALRIAYGKGVDVKLITPKLSDNILLDIARSSYLHEMHEWGGEVALYHKKMLHAKAFLIDNSSAIVGTLNFDNRSFFLNYEIVSIGYSEGMINKVEKWMLQLLKESSIGIQPAGKIRKTLENFGRIIAPQI
ncbi:MAG: PLDc N-terminal domain-containing protein [Epsilonproteobacteria bacterium]|nr:PLDc N-terminal domain-containing protein [Campylobacterota bacterium]